ncbi:MAG: hypothetical protein ABI843_09080 [Dokdonella sp.]
MTITRCWPPQEVSYQLPRPANWLIEKDVAVAGSPTHALYTNATSASVAAQVTSSVNWLSSALRQRTQKCSRVAPVSIHCSPANSEQFCDLGQIEATEKVKLNHVRGTRVVLFKRGEGIVELQRKSRVHINRINLRITQIQTHLIATTLGLDSSPRGVGKYVTHRPRRIGKELRVFFKAIVRAAHAKVGLMYKLRRTQCVRRAATQPLPTRHGFEAIVYILENGTG